MPVSGDRAALSELLAESASETTSTSPVSLSSSSGGSGVTGGAVTTGASIVMTLNASVVLPIVSAVETLEA